MKSDILNFESFINHSPLIIFIWNPIPNEPVLYVSENISQFGYSQEEFLANRIVFSDIVHPDDLLKIRSESQQHIRDNTKSFLQKYRIITRSGEIRWVFDHTWDELDKFGNTIYYYGFIFDITDQIDIEQALRESEEKFRIAAQNVSDIIYEYNVIEHKFIWFGDFQVLLKNSKEEIPRNFDELYKYMHPEDRDRIKSEMDEILQNKKQNSGFLECRMITTDGKEKWWQGFVQVIRDEKGKALKIIGILNDVTEKNVTEKALRESEETFRIVAENSSDLVYQFTIDGTMLAWFGDVEKFYGVKPDEIPKSFEEVMSHLHPSDRAKIQNQVTSVIDSTEDRGIFDYRIIKKDREVRYIHDVIRILRNNGGIPVKVIGALSDVTEKYKFEKILQQSENRFRIVAENSSDLIYEYDYNDKYMKTFGDLESLLGITEKEINKHRRKFYEFIHEDDSEEMEKNMMKFLGSKEDKIDLEYRMVRKDGKIIFCHDTTKIIRDSHGLPQKAICAISDITEKHRYEEALKVSEERFRIAAENVSDIIFEYDILKHSISWFGDIVNYLRISEDEIPKRMTDFFKFIHPDDIGRVKKELEIDSKSKFNSDIDYRIIRNDGKIRHWHSSVKIIYDSSGNPIKLIGALSDLTHQKNIEAELEIRQRMDYIGNFSAGIAHDFNNILAVILGNVSLLQMDSEHLSEEHNQIINDVSTASERAKSIIKQLQEFSSQDTHKEKAETFDLSVVVDEVMNFMKSTTNRLIQKENSIPKNRYFIKGNPAEFNQVLLNLGINSIHAIEDKKNGATTLDFIKVNVSIPEGDLKNSHLIVNFIDSGKGITDKHLKQMFIPFFTTKTGIGPRKVKGRGLGLSMVYNIITNKFEGSINVESRVDHGTIFYITLPLAKPEENFNHLLFPKDNRVSP